MNYHLRHLFEYDRSRSQAGFGSKLEQRLQKEKITKEDLWDQMEDADPTIKKDYVNWLIKAFQEGYSVKDLTTKGVDNLKKHDLLKRKRSLKPEHVDISRFRTLTDLENALKQYDLPEKEQIDKGKYKEHLKTDTVRIIEIFNLAAARYYGKGTKWCTAADTDNKFEYYINKGPIFVILPLKPTHDGERYQFGYDEKTFEYKLKDEKDRDFKYKELKTKFPDIIKFFNDLILEKIPEDKLYNFFYFIINPPEKAQLGAVSKDGFIIQYINNPSEKVQLAAVTENSFVIRHIKNPSEKVQLAAVSRFGNALEYINNPSEKVQLAAVSKDGRVLENIKNPSEKVQMAAISQNGNAIQYINNPSKEMQLTAVSQNSYAIFYIENPSEEVQLAAIKQNKNSIKFIKNPTERVLELSK